jgi:hypothetical protein
VPDRAENPGKEEGERRRSLFRGRGGLARGGWTAGKDPCEGNEAGGEQNSTRIRYERGTYRVIVYPPKTMSRARSVQRMKKPGLPVHLLCRALGNSRPTSRFGFAIL